MKRIFLTSLATAAFATAASAAVTIDTLDTDGDGFATQAEIAVKYPKMLKSDFDAADVNRDGKFSAEELNSGAAQAAFTQAETAGSAAGAGSASTGTSSTQTAPAASGGAALSTGTEAGPSNDTAQPGVPPSTGGVDDNN